MTRDRATAKLFIVIRVDSWLKSCRKVRDGEGAIAPLGAGPGERAPKYLNVSGKRGILVDSARFDSPPVERLNSRR